MMRGERRETRASMNKIRDETGDSDEKGKGRYKARSQMTKAGYSAAMGYEGDEGRDKVRGASDDEAAWAAATGDGGDGGQREQGCGAATSWYSIQWMRSNGAAANGAGVPEP